MSSTIVQAGQWTTKITQIGGLLSSYQIYALYDRQRIGLCFSFAPVSVPSRFWAFIGDRNVGGIALQLGAIDPNKFPQFVLRRRELGEIVCGQVECLSDGVVSGVMYMTEFLDGAL